MIELEHLLEHLQRLHIAACLQTNLLFEKDLNGYHCGALAEKEYH
jgi:hypothetical protein